MRFVEDEVAGGGYGGAGSGGSVWDSPKGISNLADGTLTSAVGDPVQTGGGGGEECRAGRLAALGDIVQEDVGAAAALEWLDGTTSLPASWPGRSRSDFCASVARGRAKGAATSVLALALALTLAFTF